MPQESQLSGPNMTSYKTISIPCVNTNTPLSEVMFLMGESHFRYAVVTDGDDKICGTITDGDLRRYFSMLNHFTHETTASNVMNRYPVIIEEETLSRNAFAFAGIKAKKLEWAPVSVANRYAYSITLNINPEVEYDLVLMAGGLGTRMRPLSHETPKPLLDFRGHRLIDEVLSNLVTPSTNLTHVIVNYLAEKFYEYFEEKYNESSIKIIREEKKLGTAGGLNLIKPQSKTIVVSNADLYSDVDIMAAITFHLAKNADITIIGVPYKHSVPFGVLGLIGNKVESIVEKPNYTYWISSGIYVIKKDIIQLVPDNEKFDMPNLIDSCVNKGCNILYYPHEGFWHDIGNPKTLTKFDDHANKN